MRRREQLIDLASSGRLPCGTRTPTRHAYRNAHAHTLIGRRRHRLVGLCDDSYLP